MKRLLVFLSQLYLAFLGLFILVERGPDYGPGDPVVWAMEFESSVLLSFVFWILFLLLQWIGQRTRIVMSAVFLFIIFSLRIWEILILFDNWPWWKHFWLIIHPALPELVYLIYQIKQKPVDSN